MDSSGDFAGLHPAALACVSVARDDTSARPMIGVEIATAPRFRALASDWRRLVQRCAEPNVFMEPAVAGAMYTATETPLHVLLAWNRRPAGGTDLIGVWLLVIGRPSSRLPIRTLEAPCNALTFLGSPVLDRDHAVEALAAMLDAIADDDTLPKVICANQIATDEAVFPALLAAAARRGFRVDVIERRKRAKLDAPAPGQGSALRFGSSKQRSELRRRRARLSERGALRHVSIRTPEAVSAAFEAFLDLEAAGWKGQKSRRGRAIRNAPSLCAFAQTMIAGLARDGCAGIEALHLDGRAIAMSIWLRSGRTAFGWKMAYDEAYAKWSPGSLLMQTTVDTVFSDGTIDTLDSCNRDESGALALLWPERRAIADVLIDLRPGSLRGRLTALAEVLFRQARGFARRTYKARVKPLYLRTLDRLTARGRPGSERPGKTEV